MAFQGTALIVSNTVMIASIFAAAFDDDGSYLEWALFASLLVAGAVVALQATRYGRLGSGYVLLMGPGVPFLAVCVLAVHEGGLALMSSLVVASSLIQFAVGAWLAQLRRLINAAGNGRRRCPKLDAETFRTFLLILYGAGLRSGEARRLTMADVDPGAAVLAVNESKFYRSRIVPIGADLADELRRYAAVRARRPLREGMASTFLACRDGSPLGKAIVRNAFRTTLRVAGIDGGKPGCRAPCLHSLRHSFATNRLASWYREGADVQKLLPALSTYLGHSSVAATQVYISMTPELLDEAGRRFERYSERDRSPDAGQEPKGGTSHA